MAHKTLINGTAYEISGGRTLVNGTGYSIGKGKTLVGGTGYDISFGRPIGELAIGESVFFNVNGVTTEFFVIQQGLPSSVYDSSCNGTWVLMKRSDIKNVFSASKSNDYANSDIHSYLNNTFINSLDADVRDSVKQVKIPYTQGNGTGTVKTGAEGLSTKAFLLSYSEIANTIDEDANVEGSILDYFDGTSLDACICTNTSGTTVAWWLRSPSTGKFDNTTDAWRVPQKASYGMGKNNASVPMRVRPVIVFPQDFIID